MKVSTGHKNARAGLLPVVTGILAADTIAFVDGGSGNDQITDSGDGLVTAGFKVGDKIRIHGSGSNNQDVIALAVTEGAIDVATGTLTGEIAGADVVLVAARGASFRDIYDFGVIHLFTGASPSSSDEAETGTLLAILSNGGATFTPGAKDASGLRFGDPVAGVIDILAGQTWKTNACLATGQIGWGRFYANARTQGASTTAVRFDFTVSTSGADLNLLTTQVYSGAPFTLNSFKMNER